MNPSSWAFSLWILGFLANCGLLVALTVKRKWAAVPVFVVFVAFQVFRTVGLYAVRSTHNKEAYFWLFWCLAVLDYLLQLAVIYEIGMAVMRPLGAASIAARYKVLGWSGLGIICAAGVSMSQSSPFLSARDVWDMRVSLFTSLLTCQCYLALLRAILHLRITLRPHVVAIGNGLALWGAVALVSDGIGAAVGWCRELPMLESVKKCVYIAVTIYWVIALWRNEGEADPDGLYSLGLSVGDAQEEAG